MAPIGFIQNELDLKFLVLYIMARTAGPITFLQLLELALCDAGVDYFSLTKAVEHMVETGQLSKEGDRYSITEKGVRNSQICESSLPYSVRMHCDENLVKVNEALRREAQVRSQVSENKTGPVRSSLTSMMKPHRFSIWSCWSQNGNRRTPWPSAFRMSPQTFIWQIIQLLTQRNGSQNS